MMGNMDLARAANDLEKKIASASSVRRLALQPELSRILARLKADGQSVPTRLRHLEYVLRDEAVEARFDNMPV